MTKLKKNQIDINPISLWICFRVTKVLEKKFDLKSF